MGNSVNLKMHFFTMCILIPFALHAQVDIRAATIDELDQILDLDRRVGYEYFIPLFLQYSTLPLGKEPVVCLERDLQEDIELFPAYIAGDGGKGLYVAVDGATIIGCIQFHKQAAHLFIDLLLIDSKLRRNGIGRQLVTAACNHYNDVIDCVVAVFDKNGVATKFYESCGFSAGKPADIINHYPAEYAHVYTFYTKQVSNFQD